MGSQTSVKTSQREGCNPLNPPPGSTSADQVNLHWKKILVGIMNHRGKNGRNHEYQDSNDSASTPELMVLAPFLTFQLSSGMHCRTFFVPVFLQTLRPKYRMLPSCRFFLLDILKLKIVNC